MAGQFQSAYDIAQMQVAQQGANSRLQYEAEMQKQQQEQRLKIGENLQKQLEMAVKTYADHAQAWQTKGGDLADPTFLDSVDPIRQQALEAAQTAQQLGYPTTYTPELLDQNFTNIINSPSAVQKAQAEGQAEAAKTSIIKPAEMKAEADFKRANPDLGDRKAVWNARAGRQEFATDIEIANSKGALVPVGLHDQAPSWSERFYFNPKTQEQVRGYFDSTSRTSLGVDGTPLGPDFVPMTPPQITGTPGDFGVTTATRTDLEKQGLGINESIARTESILKDFQAKYQTWGGKAAYVALQTMSKAGATLSPQQQKTLGDQRAYYRKVYENLNLTIKDVTGAAMGVQEASRIIKQVPNPDDDPIGFKAAAEDNLKALKAARMRLRYFAKNGLNWDPSKGEPPMDLETFAAMANRRTEEIRAEIRDQMPDSGDEERRVELHRRLTAEGF